MVRPRRNEGAAVDVMDVVEEARARGLETELRAMLPGYLVPRIVREVPGEAGKTPLWALST